MQTSATDVFCKISRLLKTATLKNKWTNADKYFSIVSFIKFCWLIKL